MFLSDVLAIFFIPNLNLEAINFSQTCVFISTSMAFHFLLLILIVGNQGVPALCPVKYYNQELVLPA